MITSAFFDIDGTLVSMKTHKVSERTKETLGRLREKGVRIFVATGRPIQQINNLDGIYFDGWLTVNGMVCYADGKMIRLQHMNPEDVDGIRRFFAEQYAPPTIFVNETGSTMNYYTDFVREGLDTIDYPQLPVGAAEQFFDSHHICQITPFMSPEQSDLLLTYTPGCKGMRNNKYFIDISPEYVDKAEGMKFFLDYYGLRLEDSIAFGDGENDIGMLQTAGIGVAMGNALESTKAVADIVAPTVDEEGISVVIDGCLVGKFL